MLEGAVARLLNQLLGKYVVDLDTENLNVGIFSGQVQLTDLKLKPEALYELNLPIEVKAGTIGKIWLQIPWNMLWSQPVIVNIEDLHVVAAPVVTYDRFDPEKNKRLLRAIKRKATTEVSSNSEIIGGPSSFSEYLIANIVNNMQLNISNVHIRYEDSVSDESSMACGICIGNISAEITNSKWKATKNIRPSDTCYYLIKIEAFSIYWNPKHKLSDWKLPSQYYLWRNAMSNSLKNFSINNQDFEFLIKPMTAKVKMTINRIANANIGKVCGDIIVQDCNVQISKEQFRSVFCIIDSLKRMWISWDYLSMRPKQRILENKRLWWRYIYHACAEQRIRPYTWSRIRSVRRNYMHYSEIYKKILINPNDTELKLDLQKYEDQLSIVNIVIARQQARLTVHETSLCEKSFWDILPSPERTILCEKIGFTQAPDEERRAIEHNYSFRIGNTTISLVDSGHEVLVLTLTQLISSLHPNYNKGTYKVTLKVEAVIVEGSSVEEHLIPIISSEHLTVHNSPAYFLKVEFEKFPTGSKFTHKLGLVLEYLEISYHKHAFDELRKFLVGCENYFRKYKNSLHKLPKNTFNFLREKLKQKWDLMLDIKTPCFIIPQAASLQTGENILILDLGRYKLSTDLCVESHISENATHMELEEQLYSRLHVECSDIQVLFCDSGEDWRSGRREKDTELHVLAKNSFVATYARSIKSIPSIPNEKFNVNMPTLKINISERKMLIFLKFLKTIQAKREELKSSSKITSWPEDQIRIYWNYKYLWHVQNYITLENFIRVRRKSDKSNVSGAKRSTTVYYRRDNLNEVWARCVDLPGLEDNISPSNTISNLFGCEIKEFQLVFSKSSDSADRQYMILKLGVLTVDIAYMTYGPAYQISLNSILLKDKLHTTPSGQYLDLIHSPVPCVGDVLTVLYRKVSAGCPDFWSHFHGVETSLVAEFGAIYLLLHQEAVHTFIKYARYIREKLRNYISPEMISIFLETCNKVKKFLQMNVAEVPVPPGSVKFSHSARLANLYIRVCDWDYDIINLMISGLELDFLFRANERFVFRSYLANINVEHLSDVTLYSKVLYTDEDKVFEVKYVRHAVQLQHNHDMSPTTNDLVGDGSFKLYIGQIHITFLYKLFIQLQRFIVNLEALCYVESVANAVRKVVNQATETLKHNSRIHLSVNIKGPVLLFPQKTSSPNLIIISTGEFTVENFFKEYTNEIVENILVKVIGITLSRGVMSLTSTLEMQEIIIEPVNMNLDIKRFTAISKPTTRNQIWDLDGITDVIHITLGQRDLSTILAIYSDNIGEGKLLDLLPVPIIKSPTDGAVEADETVKTLEAFFCEPKQKYMTIKFCFDGINFVLFFDSGELLSSPIRDLNHGLCKFEISDVGVSCVLFTDGSLDGKLSIDGLAIEEIGPDANMFDKRILQSPIDDNKNNNCNITVNKPPIVDLTFHQSKANDRSIDIIIGRLSLSLSVPFTEKLAMYILDCLPKDTLDTGFINHGYVSDPVTEESTTKARMTSLTVAVRINRPEFIFIVETTSNKKRYFTTRSEILSDYSRHCNRLSLVLSLSGLHCQFYDLGLHSMEPYTILKQCDVELCRTYTEEKGEKINASVSTIHVQLCNRVVYAIKDVLNDIVEHFKVPEGDLSPTRYKRNDMLCKDTEDLWEPKRLKEYICSDEYAEEVKTGPPPAVHEIFLLPKTDAILILELEEIPVIILKGTLEMTMCDWSTLLNSTCEVTFQANYFNENHQAWEPIVDPTVLDDYEYKPWEMNVRLFQDKSLPMLSNTETKSRSKSNSKEKKSASASTSDEEEESGDDMVYLQPTNAFHIRGNRNVKASLSTFLDDSDSESEDVAMEKLAAAISDLFTGDWNESESSESEHSSEGDEESEEEIKPKSKASAQSEQLANYKKSTYILIDAKDVLNVTITPTFLKVLNDLFTIYTNKTLSISYNKKSINLINDIGPHTKVELFENRGSKTIENSFLMCSKTYETLDSCPGSPTGNAYLISDFLNDDFTDDRDSFTDETGKADLEIALDSESASGLEFPISTTPHLYETINKHHLKIYVPGFQAMQTCCPKKTWRKLMKLHCNGSSKMYYLIANHTIGKHGRNVVVSSPLQVRNETCFALSILYQPSVLQQMNLEPVGDITNPFETTMRIAVLEPHEHYNVPLYIAYHCKLFIHPTYAEGNYVSDSGIWWQDLATELDTAHNFHCNPKSDSNLEVFSLRVVLRRNIDVKNAQSHFIPNYIIHLLPPLILYNYLPYILEVENMELSQTIKVESGEKSSAYAFNLSKDQKLSVRVIYASSIWSGILNLTAHLDEKVMHLTSEAKDDENKHLTIHVRADREGSCSLYFYAPYWIVNKTGLPLHIKASSTNTVYESVNGDILLFSYRRSGKQSLNMKVYESEWSNDFGIECGGTTGLIVCKDNVRRKKYAILLSIELSQMCPRFTKIVTFLPNFLIFNNTNKTLRFMEQNEKTDLWTDLPPHQCLPFWPDTSSMQMSVKYRDSKLTSQAFFISSNHYTVLRMGKETAITVEVTGGKTDNFKVTFNDYKEGDAPILIKNWCADLFLKIQQQGQGQVTLLNPYHYLTYTWDDPTKPRLLLWNVYNNKGTGFNIDISKDCYGEERINFHSVTPNQNSLNSSSSDDSDSCDSVKTTLNKKVRRDKIIIYWICYRDGMQKTLVFTQDQKVYNDILKTVFMENSDIECLISLSGVGISIFTGANPTKEHIYASISDAPAIWEVNVGHKWKTLTLELASWIEDKYRLLYKKCQLKDYVHIDFEKMFMLKPFFAELRRTYNPAVYFQFRKSLNHQYFNLKLQSVQVDNKQPSSNDSITLSPMPVDAIKATPVVEFSCFKTCSKGVEVYKHVALTAEDFFVNIGSDLILGMAKLATENRKWIPETPTLYRNDLSLIRTPVTLVTKPNYTQNVLIEALNMSQLGIQLSISHKEQAVHNHDGYPVTKLLDYLFPAYLSPYMPNEGVRHKIATLEMIDVRQGFLASLSDMWKHFSTHFLQQYYSQVLGQHVLVNPYAIQAIPTNEKVLNEYEKISSLILFGCRCFLGHINMSTAALGQCIVDIFVNQNLDHMQRTRRHNSYHKACTVPKSITASSKSFNPGVVLALEQVILKNHSAGLQCDGEIFFRGTGKALHSIVTRHPDEKSNHVQVALEALRRATILGEPVTIHQRLTRYFNKHLGLKPFSIYDSMGAYLLETVASNRFKPDTYWAHAAIDQIGKSIIIISLEHIIRVNKCRFWGSWEMEWCLDMDDVVSVPKVTSNELIINVRQGEVDYLSSAGKLTVTGEKEMLVWLQEQIEQAMVVSMEEKSWAITEN